MGIDDTLSDSAIRAAAFAVGAARATFKSGVNLKSIASILATVYVFPVPGPPVIIVKLFKEPDSAAATCQSGSVSSD